MLDIKKNMAVIGFDESSQVYWNVKMLSCNEEDRVITIEISYDAGGNLVLTDTIQFSMDTGRSLNPLFTIKLVNAPYWHSRIKTEEDFNNLKNTGYLWEFFPDIPFSWELCTKELNEYEEIKGEKEYVKSYN